MTEVQARLDLERRRRIGMIEAIWGEHKSTKQIICILKKYQEIGEIALVTRVNREKAREVQYIIQEAKFHEDANCLTLGNFPNINIGLGKVLLLTGGTSDLLVAAEAKLALQVHGIQAEVLMDIGVAGLHRLISHVDKINQGKVLIVCAGMEGALPIVIAGLTSKPVIGVPVSVGYGVSKGGRTALEGMLSSCSPGLSVVNIDNGYGAAMAALRIINS